jgi:hypothetical protein
MQPKPGFFNLVIAGNWNPYIFSPDWIKSNLIVSDDGQDHPIKLAVPLNNPDAPPQITFDGFQLFPSITRLEIKPEKLSVEAMHRCTNVAKKCLQLLNHTPVFAIGVNFGFEEQEEPEALATAVKFEDSSRIDSEKYQLNSSESKRVFSLKDDPAKLIVRLSSNKEAYIDFNFEIQTPNAAAADESLTTERVSILYEKAVAFIKDVYGLEVNDKGENDD